MKLTKTRQEHRLFQAENEVDVSEVVENTVKDFEITIAVVPRQEVQEDMAMYSSLFPIPERMMNTVPIVGFVSSVNLHCFVSGSHLIHEVQAFVVTKSCFSHHSSVMSSSCIH